MSAPLLPLPFGNVVMIAVGCLFIYLAIKKKYEPLLLIPIGFGAILVNIPVLISTDFPGIMDPQGVFGYIYAKGVLTDIFPCL